jgi:hypothetical protein
MRGCTTQSLKLRCCMNFFKVATFESVSSVSARLEVILLDRFIIALANSPFARILYFFCQVPPCEAARRSR